MDGKKFRDTLAPPVEDPRGWWERNWGKVAAWCGVGVIAAIVAFALVPSFVMAIVSSIFGFVATLGIIAAAVIGCVCCCRYSGDSAPSFVVNSGVPCYSDPFAAPLAHVIGNVPPGVRHGVVHHVGTFGGCGGLGGGPAHVASPVRMANAVPHHGSQGAFSWLRGGAAAPVPTHGGAGLGGLFGGSAAHHAPAHHAPAYHAPAAPASHHLGHGGGFGRV